MTPAVLALQKAQADFKLHQYEHAPDAPSYGLEAAEKLGVNAHRVFKTLVAETDKGELLVAIIPVDEKLNLKCLAKAAACKKADMAKPDKVQRSSGYVLGGVSPIGQKRPLVTFIHSSAQELASMYVSGGRRGLEIELAPDVLVKATGARFANLL
ncbi:Cys-tRNA(Pro) deacylase [Bowmanella yangjiangensis]|uniref:Cys-tRNA(Pro)/Cys-tRNA(Cys) deacylase n=1 Tax=Bowmanella yangjiangensis TaxID=2811230 RepID=A0ABS3CYC3_9ALTE|nr:Cys-tRNA(Pro) deacylase [Bowmanella yangjiangensis]MBN7821565.1 Cys-tRNA(Pro) deacylase [Bowmanella yangjiangensis]